MSEEITAENEPEASFAIVVNGQLKVVTSRVVTWDEVVDLAYPGQRNDPEMSFIVTYEEADESKDDGTLAVGRSVKVKKEGTVFYVAGRRRS
jgi:Multiubiquitin